MTDLNMRESFEEYWEEVKKRPLENIDFRGNMVSQFSKNTFDYQQKKIDQLLKENEELKKNLI